MSSRVSTLLIVTALTSSLGCSITYNCRPFSSLVNDVRSVSSLRWRDITVEDARTHWSGVLSYREPLAVKQSGLCNSGVLWSSAASTGAEACFCCETLVFISEANGKVCIPRLASVTAYRTVDDLPTAVTLAKQLLIASGARGENLVATEDGDRLMHAEEDVKGSTGSRIVEAAIYRRSGRFLLWYHLEGSSPGAGN